MNRRIDALDGLRGVAILLVLACHLIDLKPVGAWPNLISKGLFVGVDLFFVLSGFLITGILLRTADDPHRTRNFYVRRALRIFPAYYTVVLATTAVVCLWHTDARIVTDTREMLPSFLLFGHNLVGTLSPERPLLRELKPLWSLAVEEQFYLIWPWLIWRCQPQHRLRLCVWVMVIALAFKFGMTLRGLHAGSIYQFTLSRMDTLAAGSFLAVWLAQHGERPLPRWMHWMPWIASVCLITMFIVCRGMRQSQGPLITTLATSATPWIFGGVLYASLQAQSLAQRGFSHPLLRFFGRYSYGLYLVHFIADAGVRLWWLPTLAQWTGLSGNALSWLIAAISLLCSIGLALLLHRLIEAPALRLKKYFDAEAAHTGHGVSTGASLPPAGTPPHASPTASP